jgi:hypothetical protein
MVLTLKNKEGRGRNEGKEGDVWSKRKRINYGRRNQKIYCCDNYQSVRSSFP